MKKTFEGFWCLSLLVDILCYGAVVIVHLNRIGDVVVSVLASSAVDRGFETRSGQTRLKLVCVASPLSTQHLGERAKTGWLGIRIMC